ncbi:MAG: hypothetical protein M1837_000744 [Sclerophora amabilis]|nr:MAG: hypothetical protein M1837_000744 [Sclerophora amabilis]
MGPEYTFDPPPTTAVSPRRRQHEHHPPALSTTLSAIHRFGSHLAGQTPPSASSRSSPFSGYNPATFTASPGAASSHRSSHTSHRTSAAYNPQQWNAAPTSPSLGPSYTSQGGMSAVSSRPGSRTGEDLGGLSPPPPYSPQRTVPHSGGSSTVPNSASPGATPSPDTNSAGYDNAVNATTSSNRSITPQMQHRNSPNLSAARRLPTIPPPPSTSRREQSASRSRPEIPQSAPSLSRASTQPRNDPLGQSYQTSPESIVPRIGFGEGTSLIDAEFSSSPANIPFQELGNISPPPASRRAASTGAIGVQNAHVRLRRGSGSPTRQAWEPGMPLPPPPPGPPPNVRSQSMNRSFVSSASTSHRPTTVAAPPKAHPPPPGTKLPPVPPTPADWVDEDAAPYRRSPPQQGTGLHIDTDLVSRKSIVSDPSTSTPRDSSNASGTTVGRAGSVQHSFSKGIRERRSESKTRRERMTEAQSAIEPSNNPWADDMVGERPSKPADLVLSSGSSSLSRRRTITKSSPRSARSMQFAEGVRGSTNPSSSGAGQSSSSRNPATQTDSTTGVHSPRAFAPTPPFSPGSANHNSSPPVPPKSLPTPPPQGNVNGDSYVGRNSHDRSQTKPSPRIDPNHNMSKSSLGPNSASSDSGQASEQFAKAAIERHRLFAEKESAAKSDREKVQLFADFMVSESRIRRDRYATAMDAMGSEILELTRDLFKPQQKSLANSPESMDSDWSSHGRSLNFALQESSNPLQSPCRQDSFPGYMPSLSPILSMSVSEAHDGMSSRGRPSSRWWEASHEGSINNGGRRGFERSKRESKYMGLPLRSWDESPLLEHSAAGPSNQTSEYPPEKVGWHEQVTPVSSAPRKLDVSRLVTLPPPYPRHYPAVNNNHPDLTSIRNIVRNASDLTVAGEIKDAFKASSEAAELEMVKKRGRMREDIRRQVEQGNMTYAEAARIEEAEEKRERGKLKADFERYRDEVMTPLQSTFHERISQATSSFEHLRRQIVEQSSPMEEGDEKPELLEKLTLMKWLFEAREQLHREDYELMSERNDRYKAVVIAPYNGAGNDATKSPNSPHDITGTYSNKIREVEAFFSNDNLQRRLTFERETLSRYEAFMDVVEENVKRGVEVQLSAFWDIAPSLVEVMQRVDVARGVQTPESSSEEYTFSQQYLWEVLCHAEKSAYQFIEGQINLLCLLHGVKSGVTKQGCRVMEAEAQVEAGSGGGSASGSGTTAVAAAATAGRGSTIDVNEMRLDEEERLTIDLKEKVGVVERQWEEAMGRQAMELKGKVRDWLVVNGGWEGVEQD